MNDVTIRIIDYNALRRGYVQWLRNHPAVLEWYKRWRDHYINRQIRGTDNA